MDGKAILKTNQEQAVASWINYLNQIRLDRLMEALNQQDKNWSDAMITIEIALSKIKEDIFAGYISEINTLDQQLEEAYRSSIDRMNAAFASYVDVLAVAFVPDVLQALQGSAKLAKTMGVPTEEILDTREKVFSYFVD